MKIDTNHRSQILAFLILWGIISPVTQTREKLKCQGDAEINIPFHRTSAMSVVKQSMCLCRCEEAVSLRA